MGSPSLPITLGWPGQPIDHTFDCWRRSVRPAQLKGAAHYPVLATWPYHAEPSRPENPFSNYMPVTRKGQSLWITAAFGNEEA